MALTYDELDAHVRDKYIPVLQDQYYKATPLTALLMAKSKVVYDSGKQIDQPVLYGELPSGWYEGLDTFNIATVENTTLAKFDWKQFYVDVTIDGTTLLKIEGSEKILSIVETKMENASKTFQKQLNESMYTDQGSKALETIGAGIAETGTYGEISKDTYDWWQGKVNSTGGAFSMDMLQTQYGECSDGQAHPDLIITTQAIYNKIWARVQPVQRGNLDNTPGIAGIGFTGINFNQATIVVDNYCPEGYIYLLNTDFWKMVVHRKRDMYWTDKKVPLNQDALVRQLLWAGALFTVAPRWSGMITGVT